MHVWFQKVQRKESQIYFKLLINLYIFKLFNLYVEELNKWKKLK